MQSGTFIPFTCNRLALTIKKMDYFYLLFSFLPWKKIELSTKTLCVCLCTANTIMKDFMCIIRAIFLVLVFNLFLHYILLPVKYHQRILPLAGYWGGALPELKAALQHSSSWHYTAENIKCKGQAK